MESNTIFLRADEQMQISPICLVLIDELTESEQVGLLIRVPVLVKKSFSLLSHSVAHLPVHFCPKNKVIKKELHFIPEMNIEPKVATQLIQLIGKNPNVLSAMEEKLYNLKKRNEISPKINEMFTDYKNKLAVDKISLFTMDSLCGDILLVEQHGEIITNVKPFELNDRGGYFSFTTTVAALYDSIAQTVQVDCKMFLFAESDRLGYYFEFFLSQQQPLHQKIYRILGDLLIENQSFLEKTLTVLENSTNDQPAVVELIEKFREVF